MSFSSLITANLLRPNISYAPIKKDNKPPHNDAPYLYAVADDVCRDKQDKQDRDSVIKSVLGLGCQSLKIIRRMSKRQNTRKVMR